MCEWATWVVSLHLGVWVGHGQRSPDRSQTAKARLRPVTRDCSATLQNSCLSDFEHKCWTKSYWSPLNLPTNSQFRTMNTGQPLTIWHAWSNVCGLSLISYESQTSNTFNLHVNRFHISVFVWFNCLRIEPLSYFLGFPWIVWNGDVSSPSSPPADEWVTVAI